MKKTRVLQIPVMFISKSVEMFCCSMDDVFDSFVDWGTSMSDLLQNCLQNYHVLDQRIFKNINLK